MIRSIFWTLVGVTCFVSTTSGQLPHKLAPHEESRIDSYRESRSDLQPSRQATSFPGSNLRTRAEWEQVQALMVTYTSYEPVVREIIRAAQKETLVMVVCDDSNQVKTELQNNNIPIDSLAFLEEPYNSVWIRDYGPWSVYENEVDSLHLVDWIYNRPRPDDDVIPQATASKLGLPAHSMTSAPNDLVHTGGNFMTDGLGNGFSSKLILDENNNGQYNQTDKSEAEVDSLMEEWMGIDNFIKFERLPFDPIDHIDMHMKLLDEQTLLVGKYPHSTADGPQIEANLQYLLANFQSAFEDSFRVVRVPMPPDQFDRYPDNNGYYRTYTNAVFVNNSLLVPTYEEKYDTTALGILREALPGYNIVGINSNSIIPANGAIHCITKGIGVNDPLLMAHQPITGIQPANQPQQVAARIQHRSGIQSASIHYRTDTTSNYQSAALSLADSANNQWSGTIPPLQANKTVQYYLSAQAKNGKSMTRPMPAPEGYWQFKTGGAVRVTDRQKGLSSPELLPAYPNPSHGMTVIPAKTDQETEASIVIRDMIGRRQRVLFQGTLQPGKTRYFINTVPMASGTYLIEFKTPQTITTQKLIVR